MWYNMRMVKKELPSSVRACLWSYNLTALDLERDKISIITNVLNYGTKEATDWLCAVYPISDIVAIIQKPLPGRWDKKSLALWSLVFSVSPILHGRFSPEHALRSIG